MKIKIDVEVRNNIEKEIAKQIFDNLEIIFKSKMPSIPNNLASLEEYNLTITGDKNG